MQGRVQKETAAHHNGLDDPAVASLDKILQDFGEGDVDLVDGVALFLRRHTELFENRVNKRNPDNDVLAVELTGVYRANHARKNMGFDFVNLERVKEGTELANVASGAASSDKSHCAETPTCSPSFLCETQRSLRLCVK